MDAKWAFISGIGTGAAVMLLAERVRSPSQVPALQSRRRLQPLSRWSPTARVLSSIAAGTIAVFAVAKRVA